MYMVKITIRPDVLLTSSGWPVNHKQIRIFSNGKGTVPWFGRGDWLNVLEVIKWFNFRLWWHLYKTNKCITPLMYWCLVYSYMFRHFRMPLSGIQIWMLDMEFGCVLLADGTQRTFKNGPLPPAVSWPSRRLSQYTAPIFLCYPRHWEQFNP
jgi:hypothetical protein